MKKISTIIRLFLSAALIVCMWLDIKWALYLAVTLSAIAIELTEFSLNKTRMELRINSWVQKILKG